MRIGRHLEAPRERGFRVSARGHRTGVDDEDTLETTEGDRAWREQMQETGEQAKERQPPVPKHPEGAPAPNPPDPQPNS